jgi:hypothetical protein
MNSVTPWWEALKIRSEVVSLSGSIDDMQMSLYRSVYATGADQPLYADVEYYGAITYPTPPLVDLMAKVAVRLGGGARNTTARAIWRLDQSMGGGKSHGLIGLRHLAAHPKKLRESDIGAKVFSEAKSITGQKIFEDLGQPQVVVLACDNMTAGKGNPDVDGIATTLYERFLWRLFGEDLALYRRYQPYYGDKSKIADALTAVGRPVLILVDEILDYIRQLSESTNVDLAIKDMAFLRALLDVVNHVPNVAMVIVMIASEKDSITLDQTGQQRRDELNDLLIRNATPASATANTDFAAILRRRLFEGNAPTEVMNATSELFTHAMRGIWSDKVFSTIPSVTLRNFAEEVTHCYPFHPTLIAMAEKEWAPLAGFQKVRSTIKIFAATVFVLSQRAKRGEWVPRLIGLGDLPLSSSVVREAIIGSGLISDPKTQANYRQIAATDIVAGDDKGGSARLLDARRTDTSNPRAAERAATALFLCSIVGTRGQGKQGATEAELKAAMFVPDASFALADADGVIAELKDFEAGGLAAIQTIPGKGMTPARMFLSTRKTLTMLFMSTRGSVLDVDREIELAETAKRLSASTSGNFKQSIFVTAETIEEDHRSSLAVIESANIDKARTTRLVVLDPRRFSLLNGADADTHAAINSAMGIGVEKIPVLWASSAVFAVINSGWRPRVRGMVTTYLAWKRVSEMNDVQSDPDLSEQARNDLATAKRNMDNAVRRAYQHILYLEAGEEDRRIKTIQFEHENQSALSGADVWKALVAAGKAFDSGAFNAKALLHNLTSSDYNKPLDEVRDLFWSSPRFPLLPVGDADIKKAIFDAVKSGQLRLVGSDGVDRDVTSADEIGIGQSSLRLERPRSLDSISKNSPTGTTNGAMEIGNTSSSPDNNNLFSPNIIPTESDLSFTLMTSLTDEDKRYSIYEFLLKLVNMLDAGEVSYVKLSASFMIDSRMESNLVDLAKKADIIASVKVC